MNRHHLYCLVLLVICAALVSGCGGGSHSNISNSGSGGQTATGPRGSIKFTIQWPDRPRSAPTRADYVVVDVMGTNHLQDRQIAYRPGNGASTATLTFGPYPVGTIVLTSTYYVYGSNTPLATGSQTVSVLPEQTAPVTVAVNSTITSVSVSALLTRIGRGATTMAVATATDASGNMVMTTPGRWSWTSSNAVVAWVSTDNNPATVHAIARGLTFVKATETESGISGTVSINVINLGPALGGWPLPRSDYAATGRSTASGAAGNLLWEVRLNTMPVGSPRIGPDGIVYFGTQSNGDAATPGFYALDGQAGWTRWKVDGSGSGPALADDGSIYLSYQPSNSTGVDPTYYCLESLNGAVRWTLPDRVFGFGDRTIIGPDGTVYFLLDNGTLYSITNTGGVNWKLPGILPSDRPFLYGSGGTPSIGPDGTLYIRTHDIVYAVDPAAGAVKWKYKIPGSLDGDTSSGKAVAVSPEGTLYFGCVDHKVYALNGATGSLLWTYETGDRIWGCTALGLDGSVYAGSTDGNVYALDGATGALKWKTPTGASVISDITLDGTGTVYAISSPFTPNSGACLLALDGTTGALRWKYNSLTYAVSSPVIGPDGTIYLMDLYQQKVMAIH